VKKFGFENFERDFGEWEGKDFLVLNFTLAALIFAN